MLDMMLTGTGVAARGGRRSGWAGSARRGDEEMHTNATLSFTSGLVKDLRRRDILDDGRLAKFRLESVTYIDQFGCWICHNQERGF